MLTVVFFSIAIVCLLHLVLAAIKIRIPSLVLSSIKRQIPSDVALALKAYYFPIKLAFSYNPERWFGIIRHMVQPDDIVLDVGANFGLYTYLFSKLIGVNGRAHSYEPVPPTAHILRNNVRRLNLKNVFVREMALSSQAGNATIHVPVDKNGENFYRATIDDKCGGTAYNVITQTIDDLFFHKYSPKISFIKIDTEAHEHEVVKGGMNLIKRDKPILFIEIDKNMWNPATDSYWLRKALEEVGYHPYFLKGKKKLLPSLPTTREREFNYFFLTPEHFSTKLRNWEM